MKLRQALLLSTALGMATVGRGFAADPPPAAIPPDAAPPTGAPRVSLGNGTDSSTGPALLLPDVDVVSQRLDVARSQLQPSLGATTYTFGRGAIETAPQGDNAPLNATLLQAPGVAQDSYGQIHVRGDHNEIQFRLDGVQLPEGLAVFGQSLETRFAHSLSLITGSLPAQYGFDTAAVVDITTKSGRTDPGGEFSIYGGARDYFQPSLSYGGSYGAIDYFYTGDFLHNRVGIENPTASFNPVHDLSNGTHGLAHLSGVIDGTTRISLLAGYSNQFFAIPNNPGQTPSLGLSDNGVTSFDSATLQEHQREITDFAILSLQKQIGALDLQTSVFTRYSSLYYTPDPVGDLLFDGISQTASRSVFSSGEQTDASWKVNAQHTVRAGFQVIAERNGSNTVSGVLPALGSSNSSTNGAGLASTVQTGGNTATSDQPFNVYDGSARTGTLFGVYVQDEWQVLPQLTVNYGLRFDQVNEYTDENQVSPRINAVWTPREGTTVHAGYSRYFTPPPFELVSGNSIAQFAGTSAAPAVTQDSVVKAERDNYFDAGVDQVILPGLRAGVDAYYKAARNLIDEGQFGAPIILTAFNYRAEHVLRPRPGIALCQLRLFPRDREGHRHRAVQLQRVGPRLHRPALDPSRPRPAPHRLRRRRLYVVPRHQRAGAAVGRLPVRQRLAGGLPDGGAGRAERQGAAGLLHVQPFGGADGQDGLYRRNPVAAGRAQLARPALRDPQRYGRGGGGAAVRVAANGPEVVQTFQVAALALPVADGVINKFELA